MEKIFHDKIFLPIISNIISVLRLKITNIFIIFAE